MEMIGIAAQVGDVAGVMLVGKDEAHRVAMPRQRFVQARRAGQEFLARGHVFAVDAGSFPQNALDAFQIAAVRGKGRFGWGHPARIHPGTVPAHAP